MHCQEWGLHLQRGPLKLLFHYVTDTAAARQTTPWKQKDASPAESMGNRASIEYECHSLGTTIPIINCPSTVSWSPFPQRNPYNSEVKNLQLSARAT